MVGEVDASFMVPSTSSCQHGPPSLIRVRPLAVPRPRRYFAALRLPCSIGGRSGSPRRQPTTGRVLVRNRPHAHPPARGAQELSSPALRYRALPWRFGASQVTGSSSCVRAPVKHPAGRAAASPLSSRRRPCCLRWLKGPSAPGISALSRPLSRSPHVCAPTHRRPCCHGRRKARYRPAGLGFGRAGFAPAGRRTEFLKGAPSFLSNGPALPGRIFQRAGDLER